MSQPDNTADQPHPQGDVLVQEARARYRAEYMLRAQSKLSWVNIFRSTDGKLKKVEQIADKMIAKDIANGKLLERLAQDMANDDLATKQEPAAQATSEDAAAKKPEDTTQLPQQPMTFEDLTAQLEQEYLTQTGRREPQEYNVNIPDVERLQRTSDTGFLFYVMETLDTFTLGSPAYSECPELRALRTTKYPKGAERPGSFVTIVTKNFDVKSDGTVVRDDKIDNKIILMHSDRQQELIKLGSYAFAYYAKYGQIPLRLREEFMLEQTKDALHTAGYPFTPRYEMFCMNVMHHVSMQMVSFNRPRPQPQQPKVTVTAKINFDNSAKKDKAAAPKAKKPRKAIPAAKKEGGKKTAATAPKAKKG